MKAAFINTTGPASCIRYGDLPEPIVGPEDVLVTMTATTVDPIDTYIRSGSYEVGLNFPFIIGRDMTGVVEGVGQDCTRFKPGDRVWCNNQGYGRRQGTFAERLSVHQNLLYHLPDEAEDKQAVAIFHSALTALVGLVNKAALITGETIFINGGSGNVGTAVLQIAKARGARVAVTAGHPDKIEWCKSLGADLVIDYKRDSVAACLWEFAPEGVNVYWDATKEPDVERALQSLSPRGRMIVMSGLDHISTLPVGPFYTRNCTLYGFTITDRTIGELAESAIAINYLLSKQQLKARIDTVLPLSEAAEAHQLMDEGSPFGKIIVVPD